MGIEYELFFLSKNSKHNCSLYSNTWNACSPDCLWCSYKFG